MPDKTIYRKTVDKFQWVTRSAAYGSPFMRHVYCISWRIMSIRNELGTDHVRSPTNVIAEGMVKHKIIWC